MKHCGVDAGVFNLLQGDGFTSGQALVQHPLIQAVGFTGSLNGGRALFDLCAARPHPIPFFGELGSINPMFIFPEALDNRGATIAEGWAGSLTMGAGQFCTNPGITVIVDGPSTRSFVDAAKQALQDVESQVMLTDGIAKAYAEGRALIATCRGVEELVTGGIDRRSARPQLFKTTAANWLANPVLSEEVFGPLGIIVVAQNIEEMCDVAKGLTGQLTCTLHLDKTDVKTAENLMPIVERKAGRILVNGFPTGVEVCDAMVHGGPYPASTNFGATSVGTLSIRRFLRPVCYQNTPESLLNADLRT